MEEPGGEPGISLDLEHLRHYFGRHPPQLAEILRHPRAPPGVVFPEGVDDVAGDGGEGLGLGEEYLRWVIGNPMVRGGIVVGVPLLEVEMWLWENEGGFWV